MKVKKEEVFQYLYQIIIEQIFFVNSLIIMQQRIAQERNLKKDVVFELELYYCERNFIIIIIFIN